MKIALPSAQDVVDGHFGHCESFTVFTVDENKRIVKGADHSAAGLRMQVQYPISSSNFPRGGFSVMLAGNMGQGAANVLKGHGISVVRGGQGPLKAVVEAWLAGRIADSGQGCSEPGNHQCPDQG